MLGAVLCIGTELCRGEIINGNAAWLGAQLTADGLEVREHAVIDDDVARVRGSLERLADTHRVLVVTGGLGPTTDDLTRAAAAELLGVPLERDAESLATIRAWLERAGRELLPGNASQADFPRGSQVLDNPVGTAPGFAFDRGGCRLFFMPGVPREMHTMYERHVRPFVTSLTPDVHRHQVRLRLYGLPESAVNDRLAGLEAEHRVLLAYRAHFPEIEVKVLAERDSAQAAHDAARSAADEVRARLGAVVWGEGDTGYAATIGALLEARGLMLGVAESCTGGLCAKLITDTSASGFFAGGCVTYTNESKTLLLGVSRELLTLHGAVSREVAAAMARGVIERLGASVGLSFTGIAGPTGGTPDKPVGLVHYAVATRDGVTATQQVFPGDRDRIRLRAVYAGLELVRRVVEHGHVVAGSQEP